MKATVEYYPDLISDKMTVRWDCPVCKEVLYVTREELLDHLNHCVKDGIAHGDAEKTIADFAKAVEYFSRL